MWSGAAALCGATIVGINPTRRGEGLERDINHTECQLIVTETRHLELLDGLDLGAADGRVLVVDEPSYADALAPYADAPLPTTKVKPSDQIFLLFTSGTTGRAEGGRVLAGTPRSHRHRVGGLAEPRAVRRDVRVDAVVPLGRAVHRVGSDDRSRGDAGVAAALLRVGVPARRAQVRRHLLQLRGQAARVHPRHARAARRRRQPAATRVRQRRQRGRRAAVRSPLQLPAHRRVRADGDRRVDRAGAGHAGGLARQGHRRREGHQPGDRRRVPAGAVRRRRQAAQRRGGDGRDRELRRPGFRGLLEERRGDARALPQRRGTGPATSPTATRTASSTSPVAPPTGSGSTARTSPRRRSSASCCAGSRWSCPRCTACPTPSSATG